MDLHIFDMFNSQERSKDEWTQLVAAANPRLRIASIEKPLGNDDSIIEGALGQI